MVVTLDEAIKIHIENERKYLHPLTNNAIQHHAELHVRIFEQTLRDSRMIKRRIAVKEKAEEQAAQDTVRTQELWAEIQDLQCLLVMARKSEAGESLDGLAY